MTDRFCDHVFIQVRELEKRNELPDTISATNVAEVTHMHEWLKGQLLACHYCGHRKEVWEDGTIVDIGRKA